MIIDNIEVKGVTCDSRKVKKGYAFVAIKGETKDGNDFIDKAIEKGASIIFTEKDLNIQGVIVKKVENARKTLGDLCNAFYDYPTEKLKVIGVTGTNGKTTTTHLIYHMLKEQGIAAGLIGTLDVRIKDKQYKTKLTTPDAEVTYAYLHKMVKEKVEVVVMEVSSHGLKNERVQGIKFDIAVHTNIERDHLNFHKTVEDYIASKKKLFDQLPQGKFAVINLDDHNALKLLENNRHILVVTYGLNAKATITASTIDTDFSTSFNYCLQRGLTTLSGIEVEAFEYPITINLLGKHNIYNTLAAVTCGLLLDIPINHMAKALKKITFIPRRMEIIYRGEYMVIDDFCHNPASYETVFESLQGMQYKNLHIINAIRGSRGLEINYEIAEVLKQWYTILKVKNMMITSSSDYTQSLDVVTKLERDIYIETLSRGNISFQYEEKLRTSISKALCMLEKGDILLLLGAQGMEEGAKIFINMLQTKHKWDETENFKYQQRDITPRH
ncbi:Mur ligase family protein [Clostridium formicaceticum]|uniref:UDP-N-acetylmuramoyl-L-alanyl-D-glutamate--2, 6-diaminopimelate ligase n=1 Tax=Clostridium formicaceticum TaxID=1497 RepID=A0AAC9WFE2_9CLOT|nr:UDP-N-acetylmuramyl-tripeptide synthetase [Clostridium formicaceticum]AOY76229.1 UDP-N-acetylmuramyl peptide synthase [Clostridium formicaceticum]ARE86609.1 UDP-N-acetylmuramoyl-L-alanyl-D-glutamate--2,6-diaminopimelate ligase [Clostridium formicaceticum]